MKAIKPILCAVMVLFILFSPKVLTEGAKQRFVDTRFVRKEPLYRGTITLYHIVRFKPYVGSLSNWLQKRADEFEKKNRGTNIVVEGMSEETFFERIEHGRLADAYSFFSGSLYPDLLAKTEPVTIALKEGLFTTDCCVPYCYSGYVKLIKDSDKADPKRYYANAVLAAYLDGTVGAEEDKADELYVDLRRAGDLIRYKDGFASSELQPIDAFTDAVCWIGIDRNADAKKTAAITAFMQWLLSVPSQEKLNAIGLLSVRADVKNTAPESILKPVFKAYETIETVDPFLWNEQYDALEQDANNAIKGDLQARERFQKRLREMRR